MAASIRETQAYGGPGNWDVEDSSGPPTDPAVAARLERAAAAAKFDAFAAGDGGATNRVALDRSDERAVENAVLFETQPGDASAVDARDVRQYQLGDCHLMASLAAMALTPDGRAALQNRIVENRNTQGDVVSYTVTLHDVQRGLFGRVTARDAPVTVDLRFIDEHARVRPSGGHNELWPLVVEKACAKHLGGYAQLDRPGDPSDALRLLTGHEPSYFSLDWLSRFAKPYSVVTLQSDIAGGKLVVFSTRSELAEPTGTPATEPAYGLIPAHAYFGEAVEQHDGKSFVRLGNPWPDAKPVLIPFDELSKWFSGVHVGSLR